MSRLDDMRGPLPPTSPEVAAALLGVEVGTTGDALTEAWARSRQVVTSGDGGTDAAAASLLAAIDDARDVLLTRNQDGPRVPVAPVPPAQPATVGPRWSSGGPGSPGRSERLDASRSDLPQPLQDPDTYGATTPVADRAAHSGRASGLRVMIAVAAIITVVVAGAAFVLYELLDGLGLW